MEIAMHANLLPNPRRFDKLTNPASGNGEPHFYDKQLVSKEREAGLKFWDHLRTVGICNDVLWDKITDHLLFDFDPRQNRKTGTLSEILAVGSLCEEGREALRILIPTLPEAIIRDPSQITLSIQPRAHDGFALPKLASISSVLDLAKAFSILPHTAYLQWFGAACEAYAHQNSPLAEAGRRLQAKCSDSELSLLSYNVWGLPKLFGFGSPEPERYSRIAQILRTRDYDVVALQEMWDRKTDIITRGSGFEFSAHATGVSGLFGKSGLATLSRHPIVRTASHMF